MDNKTLMDFQYNFEKELDNETLRYSLQTFMFFAIAALLLILTLVNLVVSKNLAFSLIYALSIGVIYNASASIMHNRIKKNFTEECAKTTGLMMGEEPDGE